jgi:HK97 family phage portal protein
VKKARLRNQARNDPRVPFTVPNGTSGFLSGFRQQDREAMVHAMAALGDVYSIVSLVSSSVSRTSWHLYRKQVVDGRRRYTTGDHGDDQRTEVTRHAALDLWNKPNPFYTQRSYVQGQQQHLELTGEGWWVFQKQGNIPLNMFYVLPHRMEVVPSPQTFIAGYIYTGPNGQQVPLQTDEVIGPPALCFPNPWDPFHGLGPVQAVLTDIQAAAYSVQWNRNFFLNDARPGGVLMTNQPTMADDQFDLFADRWRESHKGLSAAGAVAVLENGATWLPATMNMREMQFAELRKISGDVIRRAWRIHKHMIGDVDDVNRANAETAEETFARWLVSERLDLIRDVLNGPYLTLFGAQDQVEFDYDDPVPDNREADNFELTTKCNAASTLVAAGYDPEDVLEVVGLPAMSFTGATAVEAAPEINPEVELPEAAEGQGGDTADEAQAELARAFREIANREVIEGWPKVLASLNGRP